ncbi:MAG: pyridoxal phosphate-dependent aminotransferase [Thermodesulfobacteriota bacterium]
MNSNNSQFISRRSLAVEWSGIRTISAKISKMGNGAISLAVGQPDFDTPQHIREAAKAALDQGYTRYPPSKGFEDLRQAIARKLKTKNNIQADPDSEIFISVGAMQSIFNAILVLVHPGDEVIVLDPGFIYNSQIRLFGGVPVPIFAQEKNRFKIDPKDIRKAVTPKTRLIILNTPSNPTGAVFDRDILVEIADIARHFGIFILSDEAYEDIVFDGKHVSIASLDGMKDLTVSVFTFSKTYAMTGWRVGYVAARSEVIDEMEKLMEHMCSGVTAVSQRAALAALQGPQDSVSEMVKEYKARRQLVGELLDDIEGLSFCIPEGTFYIYVNIAGTKRKSWELADYLVRNQKVGTVPGNAFSQNGADHIRLSFAADKEKLIEGLSRIGKGIEAIMRI